jgi:hypothetical protein
MSFVTVKEHPRPVAERELQAVLLVSLSQRDTIMEWVKNAGDEDVVFVRNVGPGGDPEDDESYILIAGYNLTTRLFAGQWLVRYPGDDCDVYVAYDVDKFNQLYYVVKDEIRGIGE